MGAWAGRVRNRALDQLALEDRGGRDQPARPSGRDADAGAAARRAYAQARGVSDDPLKQLVGRRKGRRARACPICGEPNAGHVRVVVQDARQKPPSSTGISYTLCAVHAAEVYEAAVAAVQRLVKREAA